MMKVIKKLAGPVIGSFMALSTLLGGVSANSGCDINDAGCEGNVEYSVSHGFEDGGRVETAGEDDDTNYTVSVLPGYTRVDFWFTDEWEKLEDSLTLPPGHSYQVRTTDFPMPVNFDFGPHQDIKTMLSLYRHYVPSDPPHIRPSVVTNTFDLGDVVTEAYGVVPYPGYDQEVTMISGTVYITMTDTMSYSLFLPTIGWN